MSSATDLFRADCQFILGAAELSQVPPGVHPEIAFIGRSNVGKSSLLNALVARKNLARVSVTPGRTQQLNFFLLGEKLMLADLPGYGYAKAPKRMVDEWNRLIRDYLRGRANLLRVMVLIDARRGVMEVDHAMMGLLDDAAVSYQLVLTKQDKLHATEAAAVLEATIAAAKTHAAAYPEVLITSSHTREGIDALRAALAMRLAEG